VSTSGDPVAGLFVYPGRPGSDRFVPTRRPAARTAPDGSFSLACTRTPVLLSPWPLNAPAGRFATTARWGATFVGGAIDAENAADAPCTRPGRVGRTVVQRGSAVAGAVEVPTACAKASRAVWVWLHNDRQLTVRATGLLDGSSFRVAGLPPGQHTLGAGGTRTTVTVGGGDTLTRDVTFGCADEPSVPSTTPSTTPSPAPTPSETDSPEPSSSGSGSPSPTGSATSANTASPPDTRQP
jgi:hypothetical protein